MHQQGGTIKEALDSIASHEYVLPAIQREFVWRPEQVCNLFDSVLQGYPFGEFMFWRVEAENSGQYRWYDFVREPCALVLAGWSGAAGIISATTRIVQNSGQFMTNR